MKTLKKARQRTRKMKDLEMTQQRVSGLYLDEVTKWNIYMELYCFTQQEKK